MPSSRGTLHSGTTTVRTVRSVHSTASVGTTHLVHPVQSKSKSQHYTAVDGLRALAIIGVIAYHTRPSALKGGFLGVTLFFVISGFFITRSIIQAHDNGAFRYVDYLIKRLKRIWPPVLTTIGATAILVYCVAPFLLTKVQKDACPSALMYSNWFYIFRKESYFQASGLPSPLTHLWYTSLIMQFYLLWPLLLLVILSVVSSFRARCAVIGSLAALSTIEMIVMLAHGADLSRLYYGLDTRSAELLIGALLALVVLHKDAKKPHDTGNNVPVLLGTFGCALVFSAFIWVDAQSRWMYQGGFLVTAIIGAGIVLACLQDNPLSKALSIAPLRYIGSRSFSLYLVHYPLLEVMNPATRIHNPTWWQWCLQMLVILIVGEVLYQCVEVFSGARWFPWSAQRKAGKHQLRPGAIIGFAVGVLVTIALTCLPVSWQDIAHNRAVMLRPELAKQSTHIVMKKAKDKPSQPTAKPTPEPKATPTIAPQAMKVPSNLDPSQYDCNYDTHVCHARVLVIGDSITLGAQPNIQAHFPNAVIDAKVSRQFGEGIDLYQQHIANYDPQIVVMALGVNGPVTQDMVQNVVNAVQGKPIYFLTVRAPVDWVNGNNQVFADVAKHNSNMGVIDWSGFTAANPQILGDDGTHPTIDGRESLANLLLNAICGVKQ